MSDSTETNDDYTEQEKELLKKHVTSIDSSVYCMKNLPEEVIAVLFAYVSRSPLSFRRNLIKLIGSGDLDVSDVKDIYGDEDTGYSAAKDKAQKFHDRWVVGYGHSSVAEHADIKFALEQISIILTKVIEDNRLGRFTEKSSRYQIFDFNHFYKDPKIMASGFKKEFLDFMKELFSLYEKLIPILDGYVRSNNPKPEGMSDRPYEASIKAKVCDVLRYLLPAASFTMVGLSFNARTAEHAITKLLSHPLDECQELGKRMLEEGRKICPTLLKHASRNNYIIDTNKAMEKITSDIFKDTNIGQADPVELIDHDDNPDNKIITAILYEYTNIPFAQISKYVEKLDLKAKEAILEEYLKRRGTFDWPLRALEHAYFTMDMVIDYGAFRDIQRHRICTQTNQLFSTDLGFDMPEEIKEIGYHEKFISLMNKAKLLHDKIRKELPHQAQYLVPLAYKKRVLFTWNLRELEHFIRLRSAQQGHISYRKIAIKCHELIEHKFPIFAKYLRVDKQNYSLERLNAELKTERKIEDLKKKYGGDIKLAQDS